MTKALLEDLRGDGKLEARGALMLDRGKAREKLAKFRLTNPYLYLTQLLQAAHLLGARKVEITVDSDEMEMLFDGALTPKELETLYDAAFAPVEDARGEALRFLATAVGAAQALDPKVIVFESAEGPAGGRRLTIDEEGERVEAAVELRPGRTRIYIREKFRFGHIREFFSKAVQKVPEATIIEERARFSPIAVRVNGKRISREFTVDATLDSEPRDRRLWTSHHRVSLPDMAGVVGIAGGGGLSEIHLLKNGVLVTTLHRDWGAPSLVGVLDASDLQTDLSQQSFVEDEAWTELTEHRLRAAQDLARLQFVQAGREGDADAEAFDHAVREMTVETLEYVTRTRSSGRKISDATRDLAEVLVDLPVWPTAAGPSRLCPARAFVRESRAGNPVVHYTHQSFPNIDPEEVGEVFLAVTAVRGQTNSAASAIAQYFHGRRVDMTLRMRDLAHRAVNRARWEAQDLRPLSEHEAEYIRRVELAGMEAAVQLPPTASRHRQLQSTPRGGVWLSKSGRGLKHYTSDETFFWFRVDGEVQTNFEFDDVKFDLPFIKLVGLLCEQVHPLMDAYMTQYVGAGRVVADVADGASHSELLGSARPFVLRYLDLVTDGLLFTSIFDQLRIGEAERAQIVDQFSMDDPDHVGGIWIWFADGPPAGANQARVLTALAGLSDAAIFRTLGAEYASLRQICEWSGQVLHVDPAKPAEADAAREGAAEDDLVVALTSEELELIQRFRTPVPSAVEVFRSREAKRRFMARPEVVGEAGAENSIARLEAEVTGGRAVVHLTADGGNVAHFRFLHQGREVHSERSQVSRGSFDVTVTSDAARPNADYLGVETDEQWTWLQDDLKRLLPEVVKRFWVSRTEDRDDRPPAEELLFFNLCYDYFVRGGQNHRAPALRVLEGRDRQVKIRRFVDVQESIARDGALWVSRTRKVDDSFVGEDIPVLLAQASVPLSLLKEIFDCRIADATAGRATHEEADALFMSKPPYPGQLDDAAFSMPFELGEAKGKVGLFFGTNRGILNLSILHESRLLERLNIQREIGNFAVILESTAVRPDPGYSFAATGREEAINTARTAVDDAIVALAESGRAQIAESGDLSPDSAFYRLQEELRALLGSVVWLLSREDRVRSALEDAPLFNVRSDDAKWMSRSQILESLARPDGKIPALFSDLEYGAGPPAVRIPSTRLRAIYGEIFSGHEFLDVRSVREPEPEEVRPEALAPRPAPTPEPVVELVDEEASEPEPAPHPVIEAVIAELLTIRGDRTYLLDDEMAHAHPSDDAAYSSVCQSGPAGTIIYMKHPLVAHVSEHPEDRGALRLLAVAVYESINQFHRSAVTDDDEIDFLQQALRAVARQD